MVTNGKTIREKEEVEAKKKVLLNTLEEIHMCCSMYCIYKQDLDKFIVYFFIDKNDDDAYYRIEFDYDEVI